MAQSEFAYEVTSNRVLTIWWALLWRVLVWGAVVGGVLGFVAGFVAGLVGRVDMAPTAGFMAGWLASIPLSFILLRTVLRKRYNTFVVRIVSEEPRTAQPAP